jgi:hypothetical protein
MYNKIPNDFWETVMNARMLKLDAMTTRPIEHQDTETSVVLF